MKKYFISSDIHGFFDEWSTALKEAGFDIDNPDHIIVVLGDLLDRGDQAKECLQFVLYGLPKDRRILIRGNHEDLMENVIHKEYFESHDYHNRTDKTVYQLTNMWPDDEFFNSQNAIRAMKDCKLWNDYIKECVDYYEVGDNIFVHGWIPTHKSYGMFVDTIRPLGEDYWREGNWKQARWDNGMELWHYYHCGLPGKTIWCGHWHSSWGHALLHNIGLEFNETDWGEPIEEYDSEGNLLYAHFEPFEDIDSEGCGIIAMDSCVSYSGFVNVKVLEI